MKKFVVSLTIVSFIAAFLVVVTAQKTVNDNTHSSFPRPLASHVKSQTVDKRNGKSAVDSSDTIYPEKISVSPHRVTGPIESKPPILSREDILDRQEQLERVNHTVPIPQGEVWEEIPAPTNPPTR